MGSGDLFHTFYLPNFRREHPRGRLHRDRDRHRPLEVCGQHEPQLGAAQLHEGLRRHRRRLAARLFG